MFARMYCMQISVSQTSFVLVMVSVSYIGRWKAGMLDIEPVGGWHERKKREEEQSDTEMGKA